MLVYNREEKVINPVHWGWWQTNRMGISREATAGIEESSDIIWHVVIKALVAHSDNDKEQAMGKAGLNFGRYFWVGTHWIIWGKQWLKSHKSMKLIKVSVRSLKVNAYIQDILTTFLVPRFAWKMTGDQYSGGLGSTPPRVFAPMWPPPLELEGGGRTYRISV